MLTEVRTALTFQVESLAEWLLDLPPLIQPHFEELTLDKDFCKPELDIEKARNAEKSGVLLIVTARNEGELVGYWIGLLMTHLHYKSAGLMCYTDMYFLLPEFRKGGAGTRFLTFVENTLRERGVVKAYISCKVHQDHSALFKGLGWRPSDYLFTKRFI